MGIDLVVPKPTPEIESRQKLILEEIKDTHGSLKQKDWLEKLRLRGVEHKKPWQLDWAMMDYATRIKDLEDMLKSPAPPPLLHPKTGEVIAARRQDDEIQRQIARLKDKYAVCYMEADYRGKGVVSRNPVGTIYYCDFGGGNDANDGLSPGQAWQTLGQFLNVTVRSPGDILKCRANRVGVYAATQNLDENGSAAGLIEIRGCSIADDPWGDADDTMPTIQTTGAVTLAVFPWDTMWWRWYRFYVDPQHTANYAIQLTASHNWLDTLVRSGAQFHQILSIYGGAVGSHGLFDINLRNCVFSSSITHFIGIRGYAYNCVFGFGGASDDSQVGVSNYGSDMFFDCCTFPTTTGTADDIYFAGIGKSIARVRDCSFTPGPYHIPSGVKDGQTLVFESRDGGLNQWWTYRGKISKDASVARPGGAPHSIKYEPSSNCALNAPLFIDDTWLKRPDFSAWVTAGPKTITVYIRGFGWTNFPSAAELLVEAQYWDGSKWASASSTQTISDNATWVAFTAGINPATDGFVHVKTKLGRYEASSGIYVDPKLVIS